MRWRCLMVLWGLAVVCRADEVALVRVGESWQYFLGYGEPSTPPGAWQQPVFDDAAWNRGPSGFGTIAADDATFFYELFPSLYLRRQFELTNPARVRWLVLRIEYTDGFVAYLNGVEIVRRGVAGPPNSFVPFDALAGPVRFVVVGDTGYGSIGQYQMARVMQAADPDLVMHVGDVVYPMFTAGAVDTKCFSVYQPQMRSVPYFFLRSAIMIATPIPTIFGSHFICRRIRLRAPRSFTRSTMATSIL